MEKLSTANINKWREWALKNLSDGVKPSILISTMSKNGWSLSEANSLVIESIENKVPYNYGDSLINVIGNRIKTCSRDYEIITTVSEPFIVVVNDFLSSEECNQLIQISRHKLKSSLIKDSKTGKIVQDPNRTSKGTGLSLSSDSLIPTLEKRISDFMNLPQSNGENLQVMNYQKGDQFKTHFDYLPINQVRKETGGQRVSTLIVYLNDVEAGGSTTFPLINFSVAPKKGSAVYFEYYNKAGQVNPLTLHCSEPVEQGEKWIAAKMMRELPITEAIK